MGAPLFADCGVYMNEADKDIYIAHSPVAVRQGYIEGGLGAEPGSWDDAEYVPATSPDYTKPLNDGDVIDLGGIHVEAYALPGHTHGSMVFLIPEERILITGDAANSFVFLFDESYSISVEEYRENLISVQKRLEGRFDRCFLMHREMEASKELLNSVIAVCDDILAGNTDDVPFGFMGREAYVAKAFNEKFLRADGGEGNIVYNKKMVRKNA
jgi:glyoxylase-like metal-dependent hydrolase (beta-lactamase superfamily II)